MQDRQVNVRVVAASNRDLEAMVQAGKFERAVLLCHGGSLNATDLALGLRSGQRTATALPEAGTPLSLDELERQHLVQALAQTEWNVTRAARLLDVSRDTLRYRMKRHGLQRPAASAS